MAVTIEAAHAMGAKGAEPIEAERLLFEAWMRGHCWALSTTWRGTQYKSDSEEGGDLDPRAVQTRRLWAAWRDRAALAQAEIDRLTAENTKYKADAERLRVGLRFYARGQHLNLDEEEDFDTVSGETENWLCSGVENSATMVEDGTVARFTLQGKLLQWRDGDDDETPQPIDGEPDAAMKGQS